MATYGERPGVYIDYDASAVVSSASSAGGVALLCRLDSREQVKSFYSLRAALADREIAADGMAPRLLTAAFESGAKAVFVLPAAEDTAAAFSLAMLAVEELPTTVGALALCTANAKAQAAFAAFLMTQAEQGRSLLGFSYCENADAALTAAAAYNCERLAVTAQGDAVNTAALAAAVAAAPLSDPLYGLELAGGESGFSRLEETVVDRMIAGGVTPLEVVGGRVYSIRTVSTRTATGGVADRSYLDLQTVRIIDQVLNGVRSALARMLGAVRNSTRSRLAVATQAGIVLSQMQQSELLSDYESPVVEANADDPSACNVLLAFTVARGVSRIHISAIVTV